MKNKDKKIETKYIKKGILLPESKTANPRITTNKIEYNKYFSLLFLNIIGSKKKLNTPNLCR